jgi:hypothetical protein
VAQGDERPDGQTRLNRPWNPVVVIEFSNEATALRFERTLGPAPAGPSPNATSLQARERPWRRRKSGGQRRAS